MCGMILIFAVFMSMMISKAEQIISTMNEDQPEADNEPAEYYISHPAD